MRAIDENSLKRWTLTSDELLHPVFDKSIG